MIKLYEYRLPCSSAHWKIREGLILQINEGFGEIAPLPKFSKETLADAKAEVLNWIRFKTTPTLPSVRFGIACAHKPLRSIHLPLCSLGPRDGFTTVKLKLGHLTLESAIALVLQYYRKYQLRLDCNRAWSLEQALEFAKHFKPSDFIYLEEPVRNFEELVKFSKITHFPIALDESIHQNWSDVVSLKAIVVKPTVVGSIPPIPSSLDLVLSSSYETGLGLLHIANLAQNNLPLGLDTYRSMEDDILTSPINCSSGFFSWTFTNPVINMSKLCRVL